MDPVRILVMGGTRFVGKALVLRLQADGHELTLFTRGKNSVPDNVEHITGDRKVDSDLDSLKGRSFEAIIDSSGRNVSETISVLKRTGPPLHRFLYVSSAGVYADSDNLPLNENSPIDPLSRHIGKANTEDWLMSENIPFTSFRPTYIYGPDNYNKIERWFFDRIIFERPIILPFNGDTVTHLGHVSDLAEAMRLSLYEEKATNQIFNCSGPQGITFIGIVRAAAIACDKNFDDIEIKRFDPSCIEPKARKSFPLRLTNFLVDNTKIKNFLNWNPKYDIVSGLRDSYSNDYLINPSINPDFTNDSKLIPF